MTSIPNVKRGAGGAPGWMLVRLGDELYALDITQVGEVLPVPEVSPVPMTPDWVPGVADVRGAVIPVVDVGLRLRAQPSSREGRLVLTHPDEAGERIGLLVDAVAGLVERGADPGAKRIDLDALTSFPKAS